MKTWSIWCGGIPTKKLLFNFLATSSYFTRNVKNKGRSGDLLLMKHFKRDRDFAYKVDKKQMSIIQVQQHLVVAQVATIVITINILEIVVLVLHQ